MNNNKHVTIKDGIMAISDFIEPAVKDYATQATATYSAPIDTDTFTGRQFVAGRRSHANTSN